MFIAFSVGPRCGGLAQFGHNPLAFVLLWPITSPGEIYISSRDLHDSFGPKRGDERRAYTAKGTAALLVPLANVLMVEAGWNTVFWIAAAMDAVAAGMAVLVLRPMRASHAAMVMQPAMESAK